MGTKFFQLQNGGGGADVTGGNDGVSDGDEYGIGGHGNGEGNDDDDHVCWW